MQLINNGWNGETWKTRDWSEQYDIKEYYGYTLSYYFEEDCMYTDWSEEETTTSVDSTASVTATESTATTTTDSEDTTATEEKKEEESKDDSEETSIIP